MNANETMSPSSPGKLTSSAVGKWRTFPGLVCLILCLIAAPEPVTAQEKFSLSWTNQILTARHPQLPGGTLEILYPEAFCRTGAATQDWRNTTWPHRTRLITNNSSVELTLLTEINEKVVLRHRLTALSNGIEFHYEFENHGPEIDLEWFQPACMRVQKFTGKDQTGYLQNAFIVTAQGRQFLANLPRETNALYLGGQVFLEQSRKKFNANPRPLSPVQFSIPIIGCVSADGKWLLALASDVTHELFEGIYVCLHSDPNVGGLKAGERKQRRSRLYFLPNDAARLLEAYQREF
jgi:hypothetical protein